MIEDEIKVGQVIEVLDEYRVVLNRGANDGVRSGDRFLIFTLGPELKDPESGEGLGRLEVVHGTGSVIHVQDRMATIQSDAFETTAPRTLKRGPSIFATEEVIEGRRERLPFRGAATGDRAKHVGR